MDWSEIPSLSALRAFDAAVRHGSFSKAAADLNVTHAAIAQHVRSLEKDLGVKLMIRQGRGMAATAEGRQLAMQLSDGFGTIASGVREARIRKGAGPLSITTTFAFAETWLMPRLPDFWTKHPDVMLSVSPSATVVDLRRDGFDLGIRFGEGDWPNLRAEKLGSADHVIVGTPKVAAGRTGPGIQGLAGLRWIYNLGFPEAQQWVKAQGIDIDAVDHRDLPTQSMVLSAVRAGGGISAVNSVIVETDIRDGRLELLHQSETSDRGYYLIRHDGIQHPGASVFRKWILDQAKSD